MHYPGRLACRVTRVAAVTSGTSAAGRLVAPWTHCTVVSSPLPPTPPPPPLPPPPPPPPPARCTRWSACWRSVRAASWSAGRATRPRATRGSRPRASSTLCRSSSSGRLAGVRWRLVVHAVDRRRRGRGPRASLGGSRGPTRTCASALPARRARRRRRRRRRSRRPLRRTCWSIFRSGSVAAEAAERCSRRRRRRRRRLQLCSVTVCCSRRSPRLPTSRPISRRETCATSLRRAAPSRRACPGPKLPLTPPPRLVSEALAALAARAAWPRGTPSTRSPSIAAPPLALASPAPAALALSCTSAVHNMG
mmetsp:Transcript_23839/g.70572  ORF Transcript_23839/g.70572 Transcript_23839/m.70572 type:complete len:307 (+) Transcript_23839:546-1466(+)